MKFQAAVNFFNGSLKMRSLKYCSNHLWKNFIVNFFTLTASWKWGHWSSARVTCDSRNCFESLLTNLSRILTREVQSRFLKNFITVMTTGLFILSLLALFAYAQSFVGKCGSFKIKKRFLHHSFSNIPDDCEIGSSFFHLESQINA